MRVREAPELQLGSITKADTAVSQGEKETEGTNEKSADWNIFPY